MKIMVNGRTVDLPPNKFSLTYMEILELAYPHLTVIYVGGLMCKPEGAVTLGGSVSVNPGMKIEVADTSKA